MKQLALAEKVANAVLYEGYLLYPYRPSAIKNQQRFNFGVLIPPAYSETQRGNESCQMQTECLVCGNACATLNVRVRFLHLCERHVGERSSQTCQEAIEREVTVTDLKLSELAVQPQQCLFTFPSAQESAAARAAPELDSGAIIRRQEAVTGRVEIAATRVEERLHKVSVRIINLTPMAHPREFGRAEALLRSLISTHTILHVQNGAFVSLLDPPEELRAAAAECRNLGAWPVLLGEEGDHDAMIALPIILYDYPQIAPESAGDFFDGTEIDEMLTLRVLTLTDEEKQEVRAGDERARAILERTEALPPEHFLKLHGAVRGMKRTGKPKL